MVCDGTDGNDPAAKFTYYICNKTQALPSPPDGVPFTMLNVATGKYCRSAPNPTAPIGQQTGVMCDMDTPAQGTCFSFDNGTIIVGPDPNDKISVPPDCPSCPVYIGPEGTGPSGPEPVGKDESLDIGERLRMLSCWAGQRLSFIAWRCLDRPGLSLAGQALPGLARPDLKCLWSDYAMPVQNTPWHRRQQVQDRFHQRLHGV
jgi:hypothetical protein